MRSFVGILGLFVFVVLLLVLVFGTPNGSIVSCGSDADCHAKNPGLCTDAEPYCFGFDKFGR